VCLFKFSCIVICLTSLPYMLHYILCTTSAPTLQLLYLHDVMCAMSERCYDHPEADPLSVAYNSKPGHPRTHLLFMEDYVRLGFSDGGAQGQWQACAPPKAKKQKVSGGAGTAAAGAPRAPSNCSKCGQVKKGHKCTATA
jgi:hypothetical protein